jgi:hypothetical protein
MAITNWWCGAHKAEVPLDHFQHCTYVHPDFAAAILADREIQAERTGVRVSSASACPRKYAILATEDVAVDPLSFLQAMKGTAWHKVMEVGAGKQSLIGTTIVDAVGKSVTVNVEGVVGAEISVVGEIGGIKLTGTIDRVLLRDGKLVGQDHKTGKDAREVFIRGGKSYGKVMTGQGAPIEYKIQLSIYAELYRQQFGRAWDSAEIWWTLLNHFVEPIAIMPVEQCLAHHPYDSEFTVADILAQAQQVADEAVYWQDLPLVGETFRFGPKFTSCDYCEVRDKCWTASDAHGRAPF